MIHDRGRGPEIMGTRITVYNLLPYLLDPDITEDSIATLYKLTMQQVAAARAYALNNATAVLARHREIEARIAAGNPPEVVEQMKATHARLLRFKEWLARSKRSDVESQKGGSEVSDRFPTFEEWLVEHPPQPAERS